MAHSSAPLTASPTPDTLLLHASHRMERPAACCCGRVECAYLEHNNAAMEGLERELHSAAQIGQVGSSFLANGRRILDIVFVLEVMRGKATTLVIKHVTDICAPGTTQQT